MQNIEKKINQCVRDLETPHLTQQDRNVMAGELRAYGSIQLNDSIENLSGQLELLRKEWQTSSTAQSEHSKSLVWWSRALVVITFVYSVVLIYDVFRKWYDS